MSDGASQKAQVAKVVERIGPPPDNVKIILIVCSGNICRSPMAEGYLKEKLSNLKMNNINVYSAGTLNISGKSADDNAIAACLDNGIDIRSHVSYGIIQLPVGSAGLILVMEEGHRESIIDNFPIAEGKTHLLGDFSPDNPGCEIDDPIGLPLECFQESFKEIKTCLDLFVEWLISSHKDR
jgi:low molecular weight protein-tyrosine phosphatase